MHSPFGRNFSRRAFVSFAMCFCVFATPQAHAAGGAFELIENDRTSRQVHDFYAAKETRSSLTAAVLARASEADLISLKKALAAIDRDKKQIHLSAEDGQLRITDLQGRLIAEISTGSNPESRSGFVLNERPFVKPSSGSVFEAIRRHLKNEARKNALLDTFISTADADLATQAALPIYLYIDFYDANQTPPQSHSVSQEVENQATAIKAQLMPESSNAFAAVAKRFVLDKEGTLTCQGVGAKVKATGVARIDGQMHRFESRANGDLILTPAFRDAAPVRLRPSRIDFDAAAKYLDRLLASFAQSQSPETAMAIVDGPLRTICERITMLKVDAKMAALCERSYEKRVSIEGRCLNAERGPARVECERSRGISLSQNAYFRFQDATTKFVNDEATAIRDMMNSVANIKVIGRKLSIGQCRDGMTCEMIGETNAVEMIRPAPPSPSSEATEILAKRHPATGNQPLVRYGCSVENETCSLLTETEAARRLPAKEQGRLRAEIHKANLSMYWRKDPFLADASALRPLGQCCAETPCRERLTKELGLNVKSNPTDSRTKGTAK